MYTTFAAAAAVAGFTVANAQLTPVPGVTGKLGNALVVQGNPAGVTYTATLPNKNTTGVRGFVSITSSANGTGATVNVNLNGFPDLATFGPFIYHIHDQPVPSNGNCTGTLAHLDPFIRGETPPCYAKDPASCQVGDLSGKHGNITQQSGLVTSYTDLYLSTVSGVGSFIGNRSIVVHTNNATRLNCANFTLTTTGSSGVNGTNGTSSGGSGSSGSSTGSSGSTGSNGSPPSPPKPSGSSFAGGASANVVGATALVGVAAGVFALFL